MAGPWFDEKVVKFELECLPEVKKVPYTTPAVSSGSELEAKTGFSFLKQSHEKELLPHGDFFQWVERRAWAADGF